MSWCMFSAARFSVQCVRAVGQHVSPEKCALLGTSKAVKKSIKLPGVPGMGDLGR